MNYKTQIIIVISLFSYMQANFGMQELKELLLLCKSQDLHKSHFDTIPEEIKEHATPDYLRGLPYRADQMIFNKHGFLCAMTCYAFAACCVKPN